MLAFVRRLRAVDEGSTPEAIARARREAERQLEWAEVYLAAVDGITIADARATLEARRLRGAVRDLRESLQRPHVL